ncbi:hypothetical protein M8C21_020719 [Ambrosia artemisiifolia]|uniref:Uncharacterized protein n=1 Tax=Ambrosia artemisiifolia TaxID=4212 RepID=A0AAD5CD80_AMBAR|nr:hypothetical protein M8C21_020719 [Ambrosia artemisiifolia]
MVRPVPIHNGRERPVHKVLDGSKVLLYMLVKVGMGARHYLWFHRQKRNWHLWKDACLKSKHSTY